MNINTYKVVQKVKLQILHQMKPYSNVKTIWGLTYICFSVFWALQQDWEIGSKYPKSWALIYRNSSEVLNSAFHINWNLTKVQKPSEGRVLPVLRYLGLQPTSGKLGPNWALIPQTTVRKIQKVIQSLQLSISHHIRLYSSVMTM